MSESPLLTTRFEIVARHRPISLLSAAAPIVEVGQEPTPSPQVAPYAALVADVDPTAFRAELTLASGGTRLTGLYDATSGRVGLRVEDAGAVGEPTEHRSRRWGRAEAPDQLALTLTGPHLTVFTGRGRGDECDEWTARGRVDLRDHIDVRDEVFSAALTTSATGVTSARCGGFGQLGLRDVRFVTDQGGTPIREDGDWLLTATNAGPGFFDAAHTGVWRLSGDLQRLTHTADLFFRRPDRPGVFGDHATHLVRNDTGWLVATSTWGDFDLSTPAARKQATVGVTLAETDANLLGGTHVLDTRSLALPSDGLKSVAVWDPHLVHDGQQWLVGFVSARKFFRFHPALATGPDLGSLTLHSASADRRATEGTTLVPPAGENEGWLVLASDGRDGRRGERKAYPVFDLGMHQVGALEAAYPTNLPWPTVGRANDGDGDEWLMVGFDGTPAGGSLLGYGTHGDLIIQRGAGRRVSR